MRRRLRSALRIRYRTSLDDVPGLGVAEAHGLAGKTLCVAVVTLEGALRVGGVGKDSGREEAEEADDEEWEVHGGVGDLGSRVG